MAGLLAGCGGDRHRSERVSRSSPATETAAAPTTTRATAPSVLRPALVGVLVSSHGHVIARLDGQNSSQPAVTSITNAVSDGDGGWYVAGAFTKLAGVREHGIAHILANGKVDRSWRGWLARGGAMAMAATRGIVYVAVVRSPASVLTPPGPSGYPATRLLAFSARTGATESAPGNPRYPITAMTAAGTRLLIGQGAGSSPDGPSCLLAYNTPTRQLVPGFHADIHLRAGYEGNACVAALVIHGRQLYVGGTFDHVNAIARPSLARLDLATGTLDRGWRPSHRLGLPAAELAIGDGLVITDVGNGALGALSTRTGALDRHWVWPPPHDAPGTGLLCCAATRAIVADQLLVAADSPETLAAINLHTETLTRYPPDSTIDAIVDVTTPSGKEILAGFTNR